MILISTAHSSKDRGAENKTLNIDEYKVSSRASETCFSTIRSYGVPCILLDIGHLDDKDYAKKKIEIANSLNPTIAVEMHCNGNEKKEAKYAEVIYQYNPKYSKESKKAAEKVMNFLDAGFSQSVTLPFTNRGARSNSVKEKLFFLDKLKCPSIIVEGLFISNDSHARWLKESGDLAYGVLVGDALAKWYLERK